MVTRDFNWEAVVGRFLNSRTAWFTEQAQGQSGLHKETLSGKTKEDAHYSVCDRDIQEY